MTDTEKQYFSDMYEKHAKSVYGICLMYLKNKDDAEEAVTEAFIRIMQANPIFENDAHTRAYLIQTAVNISKNLLKSNWHRNVVKDEDVLMYMATPEEESVMEELLQLPPKYRVVLYMHYYEGYKAQEIADMMKVSLSAVLSRLARGRKKLKDILTEGGYFYA
ncbi:MAG: RNA polymerase sigma factor [Clostridia bacterium]|nr:RNA polymerase sigma factor [Clostridia bacterium]MCI9085963.1 RNA polymerase sigma factor [Clostridia bacterium]